MATLYTQQSKNVTKTWILMSLFLVIVVAIGYFFSVYYRNINILYFFILFSILMNFISYWYSDKITLSLNRAKEIKKEDSPILWNTVENLSITAGLPMPKVYIIDDPAPNAFATGRNKNHAVVAATTGLLQVLDKSELEGVIAHELSHIGNRDILLSTVVVVLVTPSSTLVVVTVSVSAGGSCSTAKVAEGFRVQVAVSVLVDSTSPQPVRARVSNGRTASAAKDTSRDSPGRKSANAFIERKI